MNVRTLSYAAILATSVAMPALAQQPVALSGLYVGLGAGPNWLQNEHINSTVITQGLSTPLAVNRGATSALDANVGFTTVLSVGYALPGGVRFELEGDYRRNSLQSFSNVPFATNTTGTEQKYGFMINALYDVSQYIPVPWVQPYVGAGVGYSWNQLNSVHINGAATGFPAVATGGTKGAFAYQAIVGAAYPIVSVRGLALTMEYRFFGVNSRNYDITAVTANNTTPLRGSSQAGMDFNHSLMIGLRYNFLPPPPPPPPAPVIPAAAPTRTYMVFFDWDRADLTDRARQIISEAATNSTKVQHTRIEVNGYTDTSGTPKYNMALSIRRAKTVQAELIKDGVAANDITIQGLGDTNLLVPTGPGVREPQNRRVEIILR
jgi:outer membrane protein OmpA-like peptidoglycan-associated protein